MAEKSFVISADVGPFEEAMLRAAQTAGNTAGQIKAQLEGLNSTFEALSSTFSTLFTGAIGAAIGAIGVEIDKLGGHAVEISTMAETIGVTTAQFQAMSVAAEEAGESDQVFSRAAEKLANTLTLAHENSGPAITTLRELGVTTQQISDPTFGLINLLALIRERLLNASTATAEHNALLQALGPRAAQAEVAIKAFDGSLQGVAAAMAKINGLDEEQIKGAKETYAAWHQVGTEMENAFTKALVKLKEWNDATKTTTNLGDQMVAWAKKIAHPFDSAETAAFTPANANVGAAEQTAAVAQKGADAQITASHQVTLETLQDIKAQIDATDQGSAAKVALVKKYYEASLEFYGKAAVPEVAAAHAQLLAEERAYQEARIRAEEQGTEAIRRSTEIMAADARKAIEEETKNLKDLVEASDDAAKAQEDVQIGAIDRQIAAVKAAVEEKRISEQQGLSQTMALLDQRYAAEVAYYMKLRALEMDDSAQQAKTDEQITKAHEAYLDARQKAELTAALNTAKVWKQFGDQIANSFASNLTRMMEGTETFGAAVRNIFASIVDQILKGLAQWVAQWIEQHAIAMVASKTTDAAEVASNAGVAASAAMGSVAAIPFVGWAMAPGVGAATFAEAMSYSAADKGFDIPANVNPLTQLHAREMVLPADLADKVRGRAAEPQAGGGGGDVHHYHIQATDAQSFSRMLDSPAHQRELARNVQAHVQRRMGLRR